MLFDNTMDYISWGLWASEDKFPAGVMELRGQELVDLVLELTPNWHQDFRRLFELADPTSAFPLRIATSEPVPAWNTSNITLLGDAIHTMTPGQGVGATPRCVTPRCSPGRWPRCGPIARNCSRRSPATRRR